MRKQTRKLKLHKESLKVLGNASLTNVVGGVFMAEMAVPVDTGAGACWS